MGSDCFWIYGGTGDVATFNKLDECLWNSLCFTEVIMTKKELQTKLDKIQKFVNKQAKDEGLFFLPETITEDYLQRALRELHQELED